MDACWSARMHAAALLALEELGALVLLFFIFIRSPESTIPAGLFTRPLAGPVLNAPLALEARGAEGVEPGGETRLDLRVSITLPEVDPLGFRGVCGLEVEQAPVRARRTPVCWKQNIVPDELV